VGAAENPPDFSPEETAMKTRIVIGLLCLAIAASFFSVTANAEPGVAANQITVGMSTVLTGPASFLGHNYREGAESYLNTVNESGGVNGRKIKLIVYDDGYEPNNAVANATKLIKEDKVFCLLGNAGTPTTLAIKSLLSAEKVPLFAPFTGAESLRNPVDRYIFHYRASYNQEVEVFIQGAVDTLGYRKVAVFYQDDAYGKAVLDAAKASLRKRGLLPSAAGTYTRNLEDVYQALEKITAAKPEAVVMAGTYSACAKFIIGWKRQFILGGRKKDMDPVFMNVSFVGPVRLAELLDKYADGVVITQVVPPFSPGGNNYPAVNDYLAALGKYYPRSKPSFGSLEGFLATRVFVEVLKRTGKDLTRESFIRTAESVRNLDIQAGNTISFSNENHQGSQTVYPTVIKNGAFRMIGDWTKIK
jgi:ABC-type branched-subunit amino acid transport system substrate-binding protein